MSDVEALENLHNEPSHPSDVTQSSIPLPGSLTKRTNRTGDTCRRGGGPVEVHNAWNKFANEPCSPKKAVTVSAYSKEEATRRRLREKELREYRDRAAKKVQERAEKEAARQAEEKERAVAERKAWAAAKLEQREERIRRAVAERRKREQAYNELLQKTREKGLLFERLQSEGDQVVAAVQQQKIEEYKTLLAPAKKITAKDMQVAGDLHPSLRALQRLRQAENLRRDAHKEPLAFSPKHVHSPSGGSSPLSSAIGERIMPGSARSAGYIPRKAKSRERSTEPKRVRDPYVRHIQSVDRACSPMDMSAAEAASCQPEPGRRSVVQSSESHQYEAQEQDHALEVAEPQQNMADAPEDPLPEPDDDRARQSGAHDMANSAPASARAPSEAQVPSIHSEGGYGSGPGDMVADQNIEDEVGGDSADQVAEQDPEEDLQGDGDAEQDAEVAVEGDAEQNPEASPEPE